MRRLEVDAVKNQLPVQSFNWSNTGFSKTTSFRAGDYTQFQIFVSNEIDCIENRMLGQRVYV